MRVHRLDLARYVIGAICVAIGTLWLAALPAGAASLPDGRVYELVSPAATEGSAQVYVPSAGFVYTDLNSERGGIITGRPFEVAPDGEALVYAGDPPVVGGGTGSSGQSNGDEYLATRFPAGGWTQVDVQPIGGFRAEYRAFSNDLSQGILNSGEPLVTGSAPGEIYSHTVPGGGFQPLYSGALSPRIEYAGANTGTSTVAASSHLLFSTNEALLEGGGSLEKELEEKVKKSAEEGHEADVLYDSVADRLGLVSVLPDGRVDVNASFEPGQATVISPDGSRVFWTDLNTGDVYVRENGTSTIPVSAGAASFLTASTDGRYAFYKEGERLFRFTVEGGARQEIAGEGANFQGILGVSDDGSYVYFAAGGVLASNENGEHEKAVAETCEPSSSLGSTDGTPCNVYVNHEGVTTFIAALSGKDGYGVSPFDFGETSGDWKAAAGYRTAEVTPDGHSLIFMSERSLTGYDNMGVIYKELRSVDEIFIYQAGSQKLACVSCDPSGEAPVTTELSARFEKSIGGFFPIPEDSSGNTPYQQRAVSEDGSRVFFDSGEPLLPRDTNGWVDVYEWEREGSGGCGESEGCLHLLTDGADPENSFLLGASASGNDVFVITKAHLVARDSNDSDDVYDARVGGVEPPPAAACSGTGCQGVAPAPPIFATPSSVTFNGVGNFEPPVSRTVVKAKIKTKAVKCKKGYFKKKRRCVRKARIKKASKSARGRK
jgi:hypothetical protein